MRLTAKILLLLVAATAQAASQAEPSLEAGTVVEASERLKAGEYLWAPQVAPEGPVLLVINRTTQRMVVYRNGVPIGISTVSTGRPGYRTPTGIFTILQKHVEHYSNIYDNAPMPYMQRLTWQGVALHAGNLPGYPASHGCIRLPHEFARLLFDVTRLGMTVVITDRAVLPSVAPTPDVLVGSRSASTNLRPGDTIWHPEVAPDGPVSIVVSSSDRRVAVLRNGVLIGSAPIEIDGPVGRATVYVLRSSDSGGRRWLRVPLPGQNVDPAAPPELRGRIRVADRFRTNVEAILEPGSTVVVTPDSLRGGGTEHSVTVIQDDQEDLPR